MKTIIVYFISLFFACQCLIFSQDNRYAFVIGNSDYLYNNSLKNPANDATKMAELLEDLGFVVTKKINLKLEEFEKSISTFIDSLKEGDITLIYYSGHGAQVDGENYLIPVDAKIMDEVDIKYKSTNLGYILEKLDISKSTLNLVILDACRNNPFKGFKTFSSGLALVNAPFGTLISYSTAPGKVAYDGSGANSPFTKWLLKVIPKYGLKVEEVFKLVRKEVAIETDGKQIPWESSSLIGDFYFVEKPINSNPVSDKFVMPNIVTGYINSPLLSYFKYKIPEKAVGRNEEIIIEYEILDINLLSKITPLYLSIVKRVRPTSSHYIWGNQYEINPGKNRILLQADFELDEYEMIFGFYFKEDLNTEYPTFYNKKFKLIIGDYGN